MKSKKQILNTTNTWLEASEARIVLGVSAKNLAATAKRKAICMKEKDGRAYVYKTKDVKKAIA